MNKSFHKKWNNNSFCSIWEGSFQTRIEYDKICRQVSHKYQHCEHIKGYTSNLPPVLKQGIEKRMLYFSCNILSCKVSERVISEKKSPSQQDKSCEQKEQGIIHKAVEYLL